MYIKEGTFQWLEANTQFRAITDISNSKISILTLTFPIHRKGTRHDPQSHGFEFCAFWGGIGRQLPRNNIVNDCKWRQKITYIVTVCTLEGLSPLRHFYMLPLVVLGQLASKSSLLGKTGPGECCNAHFYSQICREACHTSAFSHFLCASFEDAGSTHWEGGLDTASHNLKLIK